MPGAAATLESARVAKLEQAYLSAKQAYSLAGGKSAGRSVYTELKAAKKDALITVGVLALALCAFIGFGSAAVMFVYSLRPEFFGEHQARLSHKDPSQGRRTGKTPTLMAAPVLGASRRRCAHRSRGDRTALRMASRVVTAPGGTGPHRHIGRLASPGSNSAQRFGYYPWAY